jgi:hypothetical protein
MKKSPYARTAGGPCDVFLIRVASLEYPLLESFGYFTECFIAFLRIDELLFLLGILLEKGEHVINDFINFEVHRGSSG